MAIPHFVVLFRERVIEYFVTKSIRTMNRHFVVLLQVDLRESYVMREVNCVHSARDLPMHFHKEVRVEGMSHWDRACVWKVQIKKRNFLARSKSLRA